METEPLIAHSIAEAYLYIMALPCQECDGGPLDAADAQRQGDEGDSPLHVSIDVVCQACGFARAIPFSLPNGPGTDQQIPVVNPTADPSQIVDIGQWILLFRMIAESAAKQEGKADSRRLGLEAAQCLEEALKFYEHDNDLPPASAVFTESTRVRLREHPQQFSRQRLLNLRAKLPSMAKMQERIAGERKKRRPIWRRWLGRS